MNYITAAEMGRVFALLNVYNQMDDLLIDTSDGQISVETAIFDINGELLGTIKYAEPGYAFYTHQDDE